MAKSVFQQQGKRNWNSSNSLHVFNANRQKGVHRLRGKVTMLPAIGCSLIRTFMTEAIKDAAIGVAYYPLLAGNATQVHSLICTFGAEASKRRTAMTCYEQAQRPDLGSGRQIEAYIGSFTIKMVDEGQNYPVILRLAMDCSGIGVNCSTSVVLSYDGHLHEEQVNARAKILREFGVEYIVAFMAYLGGIQSTQHLTLHPNTEAADFPATHSLWESKRYAGSGSDAIECGDRVALMVP